MIDDYCLLAHTFAGKIGRPSTEFFLVILYSTVGAVSLPGWGPRDPLSMRYVEGVAEAAKCHSRWRSKIRNLSYYAKILNLLFSDGSFISRSFVC